MPITPENEREILMVAERDKMEAEQAAIIAAALAAQLDALISEGMTEDEIRQAPQRVQETNDELEAALVALLLAALGIGLQSGQRQIGEASLAVDPAETAVNGQQMARQRARQALALITATTVRGLREAISDWLQQAGRDIAALIDEVRQLFSPERAEAIARTEGTYGFDEGITAVGVAVGATQMRWYTMQDERVCPICRPLHGKRREINGLYEGNQNPPPAHPYCRCGEEIVLRSISA